MEILDRIFSRTADAVFAIDAFKKIIYSNKALLQLINRPRNELVGRYCYNAINATNLNGDVFCDPDCPIAKGVASSGCVRNQDLVIPHSNGLDEWVNVGVLVAPPEWRPADIVFIVRPFSVPGILNRFVRARESNVAQADDGLTHREQQILIRLARGEKIPSIAEGLHICDTTVRNHISNIYQKLDIHSRAEIVNYAHKRNLI